MKKNYSKFCSIIVLTILLFSCHSEDDNSCNSTSVHDELITSTVTLWPGGIIPYEFHSSFPNDKKQIVLNAMSEWETNTKAIHFRKKTNSDNNFVLIKWASTNTCSSSLGCYSGGSIITFSDYCRVNATYYHEIGHLLGMPHEHQRIDRYNSLSFNDETLDIISADANITESMTNNIKSQVYKKEKINYTNNSIFSDADTRIPFDKNSIMMYGSKLSNPNSTVNIFLTTKNINLFTDRSCNEIAAPNSITDNDIKKVQVLYPKVFIIKNSTDSNLNNVKIRLKNANDITKVLYVNSTLVLTYNKSDGYYYYDDKIVQQIDFNNGYSSDDMNFQWAGSNIITYTPRYNSTTTIASKLDETPNLFELKNVIDSDGIDGSGGREFLLSSGEYNDGTLKSPSAIFCNIIRYNP